VESELGDVDDWRLASVLSVFGLSRLREETPEFINVDGWAELSVEVSSEDSDTLLSEMSRVEFEDV